MTREQMIKLGNDLLYFLSYPTYTSTLYVPLPYTSFRNYMSAYNYMSKLVT